MGAWGTGTFDNDMAADFLIEYEEGGGGVVEQALKEVQQGAKDGYIDADIGASGLAAAEIVAFSLGRAAAGLDDEILKAFKVHDEDVSELVGGAQLASDAVALISSADGTSELYELWSEGEELEVWLSVVAELKTRLGSSAQ